MVGIIMGSSSDLKIMNDAADFLKKMNIPHEVTIVSAHRTPERMFDYAKNAHAKGFKVIIAGAGGAAHLPGMVASLTPLPVIGVPVKSLPNGVPVATVAVNAAQNAGILAAQILGCQDKAIFDKLVLFKEELKEKVMKSLDEIK